MGFERIILATASPRRVALFHQLGLSFDVQPSSGEEPLPEPDEPPAAYATRLAVFKAKQVQEMLQADDAWVIGADTVVVRGKDILGKPQSEQEARQMLTQLSGEQHEVVTGFAILHRERNIFHQEAVHTKVWFWGLTPQRIADYVATGEPMDKAGSYGIQEKGAVLVKQIEGCYFNVVGLPISHVIAALEHHQAGSVF